MFGGRWTRPPLRPGLGSRGSRCSPTACPPGSRRACSPRHGLAVPVENLAVRGRVQPHADRSGTRGPGLEQAGDQWVADPAQVRFLPRTVHDRVDGHGASVTEPDVKPRLGCGGGTNLTRLDSQQAVADQLLDFIAALRGHPMAVTIPAGRRLPDCPGAPLVGEPAPQLRGDGPQSVESRPPVTALIGAQPDVVDDGGAQGGEIRMLREGLRSGNRRCRFDAVCVGQCRRARDCRQASAPDVRAQAQRRAMGQSGTDQERIDLAPSSGSSARGAHGSATNLSAPSNASGAQAIRGPRLPTARAAAFDGEDQAPSHQRQFDAGSGAGQSNDSVSQVHCRSSCFVDTVVQRGGEVVAEPRPRDEICGPDFRPARATEATSRNRRERRGRHPLARQARWGGDATLASSRRRPRPASSVDRVITISWRWAVCPAARMNPVAARTPAAPPPTIPITGLISACSRALVFPYLVGKPDQLYYYGRVFNRPQDHAVNDSARFP